MRVAARLWLICALTFLLGMAAPPEPNRTGADETGGSEEEDAALIAELNVWEERAVAENLEFFQSLDVLQKAPLEERTATEEEAN